MDVTYTNFYELLPKILQSLDNASFIAIDTEFTGMLTDNIYKKSLFDSGSTLYEKERKNMVDVTINQFGLSIFNGSHFSNQYKMETYNFYICPKSILSVDNNIIMQVTSLEFFKDIQFNFNKWLYEGIPCLNLQQEKIVKEIYTSFLENPSKKNYYLRYEVLNSVTDAYKWSKEAEASESLTIKDLTSPTDILCFLSKIYHFNNCRMMSSYDNNELTVTIFEGEENERQELMRKECLKTVDCFVEHMKGIVYVFDALVQSQKPIIVHNGLKDLMLIYKQFHKALPKKWTDFKADVHHLFPVVYDTKTIAQGLFNKFRNDDGNVLGFLRRTNLASLKSSLTDHKIVQHAPYVSHSSSTPKYSNNVPKLHEAGFDAYCTGFIFLQMSHIYASLLCENAKDQRPLNAKEHVIACERWESRIPVQGAAITYIRLNTNDDAPMSDKSWLVVQCRNPFRPITSTNVEVLLAPLGDVNILPRNYRSVLVAAQNSSKANNIIRTFNNDMHLTVSYYRAIKHSPSIRNIAWSCALFSTGVSTWLIYRSWKKLTSL